MPMPVPKMSLDRDRIVAEGAELRAPPGLLPEESAKEAAEGSEEPDGKGRDDDGAKDDLQEPG